MKVIKKSTYFKGDLAQYTGKKEVIYGGVFYEILIFEGHLKGELKLTSKAP
jgi:hypothetical protein